MSDINKIFQIELTLEELQLVNTALKRLPFKQSGNLIKRLREQYNFNMKKFYERLTNKE